MPETEGHGPEQGRAGFEAANYSVDDELRDIQNEADDEEPVVTEGQKLPPVLDSEKAKLANEAAAREHLDNVHDARSTDDLPMPAREVSNDKGGTRPPRSGEVAPSYGSIPLPADLRVQQTDSDKRKFSKRVADNVVVGAKTLFTGKPKQSDIPERAKTVQDSGIDARVNVQPIAKRTDRNTMSVPEDRTILSPTGELSAAEASNLTRTIPSPDKPKTEPMSRSEAILRRRAQNALAPQDSRIAQPSPDEAFEQLKDLENQHFNSIVRQFDAEVSSGSSESTPETVTDSAPKPPLDPLPRLTPSAPAYKPGYVDNTVTDVSGVNPEALIPLDLPAASSGQEPSFEDKANDLQAKRNKVLAGRQGSRTVESLHGSLDLDAPENTPARYGAILNSDGRWAFLGNGIREVGDNAGTQDAGDRADARKILIDSYNAALDIEQTGDSQISTERIEEIEGIKAQKATFDLEAGQLEASAASMQPELNKLAGDRAALLADAERFLTESQDPDLNPKQKSNRKGRRTKSLNEAKDIATKLSELTTEYNDKKTSASGKRDQAAALGAQFTASEEVGILNHEKANTLRSGTDASLEELSAKVEESYANREADVDVARSMAEAQRFSLEQAMAMEAEHAELLKRHDGERSRTVEEKRGLIDGLYTQAKAQAEATGDAERKRLNAIGDAYKARYLEASTHLGNVMTAEGNASLNKPINGREPGAEKMVNQLLTNMGFDLTSDVNTHVKTVSRGMLKPQFMDRYFYNTESDTMRGVVMVARYDIATGQLVRFDAVKRPFDGTEKAWRKSIDEALKAEREVKVSANAVPEPDAEHPKQKLKPKERYASMLMGYGVNENEARSRASKSVNNSFWSRFWGW